MRSSLQVIFPALGRALVWVVKACFILIYCESLGKPFSLCNMRTVISPSWNCCENNNNNNRRYLLSTSLVPWTALRFFHASVVWFSRQIYGDGADYYTHFTDEEVETELKNWGLRLCSLIWVAWRPFEIGNSFFLYKTQVKLLIKQIWVRMFFFITIFQNVS